MPVDRTAFRSERLDVSHFARRFSEDNLAFWVPLLAEALRLGEGDELLDVGCGTGGFSRALAERGARVTGLDRAAAFLAVARGFEGVAWVEGEADGLPFADASFDRVLLSLVLHQLAEPERGVAEAFRVLRPGGHVVVRTFAPEDAVDRVPERFVPSMAAADAARLPQIEAVVGWLEAAGFVDVQVERHLRNKQLDLAEEERSLRAEVAGRYAFVSDPELEEGLRRMREAAEAAGERWIDPRPAYLLAATRPSPARPSQRHL